MALQKSLQTKIGIEANYWKITNIILDILNQEAEVMMSLYKDKSARDAGASPIDYRTFTWNDRQIPKKEFPFMIAAMDLKNPIKIGYEEIKKSEEFKSALDI